jgi:hypothetical protein
MPNYKDQIKGFVVGDDVDVERTCTGIPAGQTVTTAWLTVKESVSQDDNQAVFQKVITPSPVSGQGQITDDGDGDGIAVLYFHLTAENTALLKAKKAYLFDVQIKTSALRTHTPYKGIIIGEEQVTIGNS